MKKLLPGILTATWLLFASSVHAQGGDRPGRMDPAVFKQKLMDSLQLTTVQADSVVAIGQEFHPKMRDIFMNQEVTRDEKQTKLGELNEQRNKRIRASLGDELFKRYQEWEQRNRPQRGTGMSAGGNQ
jgi:hypothetical protein